MYLNFYSNQPLILSEFIQKLISFFVFFFLRLERVGAKRGLGIQIFDVK